MMKTEKDKTLYFVKKYNLKTFKIKGNSKNIPDYPLYDNSWYDHMRIPDNFEDYKNIAITTGRGIFVIDVDIKENVLGNETLTEIEEEFGTLPFTAESITGSGGRHLYYAYDPNEYTIPNYQGHLGSRKAKGIDVRGEGGYVIAPGSVVMGKEYKWAVDVEEDMIENAPEWLLKLLHKDPITHNTPSQFEELDDFSWHDVKHAIYQIDPNLGEHEWWQVCCAMVSTGRSEAFDIFDNWSSGSKTKYSPDSTKRKWNNAVARGNCGIDYRMIFRIAKDHGWDGRTPSAEHISRESFPFAYDGSYDPDFLEAMETSKTEPDQLPDIPFLHFRKLVENIYDHCVFKYPRFSIHTALAAISALVQNKWTTPTGFSLGFFQILMADTGAGKEQYADILQEIVINALMDNGAKLEEAVKFLASVPSSGPALVNEIYHTKGKSMLLLEKEGDIIFKNKLDRKSNPQADSLNTVLMKLYGSKENTVINGESSKRIMDSTKALVGGSFSIFATCTQRSGAILADPSLISSGLINRFLIVPEEKVVVIDILGAEWDKNFEYDRVVFSEISQAEFNGQRARVIDRVNPQDRLCLGRFSRGFQAQVAKTSPRIKDLVARIDVQAVQVASLIAIYEAHASGLGEMPNVDGRHYDFAFKLLKSNAEAFINLPDIWSQSERKNRFEGLKRSLQRVFAKQGGAPVIRSDLTKLARRGVTTTEIDQILNDWADLGLIVVQKEGRTKRYVPTSSSVDFPIE